MTRSDVLKYGTKTRIELDQHKRDTIREMVKLLEEGQRRKLHLIYPRLDKPGGFDLLTEDELNNAIRLIDTTLEKRERQPD